MVKLVLAGDNDTDFQGEEMNFDVKDGRIVQTLISSGLEKYIVVNEATDLIVFSFDKEEAMKIRGFLDEALKEL